MSGCVTLAIPPIVILLTLFSLLGAIDLSLTMVAQRSGLAGFVFLLPFIAVWSVCKSALKVIDAESRLFRVSWIIIFTLMTAPLPLAIIVEHVMTP